MAPNNILVVNIYGGWKRLEIFIYTQIHAYEVYLLLLVAFDTLIKLSMKLSMHSRISSSQYYLSRENKRTHTGTTRKSSFFILQSSFNHQMKSHTLLKNNDPLLKILDLSSKLEKMTIKKTLPLIPILFDPRGSIYFKYTQSKPF